MSTTGIFSIAMLLPGIAAAHPEHASGHDSVDWAHFLSDPFHIGVAVLALGVGLRMQRRFRSRTQSAAEQPIRSRPPGG